MKFKKNMYLIFNPVVGPMLRDNWRAGRPHSISQGALRTVTGRVRADQRSEGLADRRGVEGCEFGQIKLN